VVNQAQIDQNEQLLAQFLDNADKKFIHQVGLTALAILTEQMPPEQYQSFLKESIESAHEIQKYKSLNTRGPKIHSAEEEAGAPARIEQS